MKKEAKKSYAKKVLKITERHFHKYGTRRMTIDELDELCGLGVH